MCVCVCVCVCHTRHISTAYPISAVEVWVGLARQQQFQDVGMDFGVSEQVIANVNGAKIRGGGTRG